MEPPPAEHKVEPFTLLKVVRGPQSGKGTVGAHMQAKVRAARTLDLEAIEDGPWLAAASRLQGHPQPDTAREDESRPD
jgi:hypothetical protein